MTRDEIERQLNADPDYVRKLHAAVRALPMPAIPGRWMTTGELLAQARAESVYLERLDRAVAELPVPSPDRKSVV